MVTSKCMNGRHGWSTHGTPGHCTKGTQEVAVVFQVHAVFVVPLLLYSIDFFFFHFTTTFTVSFHAPSNTLTTHLFSMDVHVAQHPSGVMCTLESSEDEVVASLKKKAVEALGVTTGLGGMCLRVGGPNGDVLDDSTALRLTGISSGDVLTLTRKEAPTADFSSRRCLVFGKVTHPGDSLSVHNDSVHVNSRVYRLDDVFPPSASPEELFRGTTLPALEHALGGRSSCVLALNIGGGETHIMGGRGVEVPGLVVQAAEYLCDAMREGRVVSLSAQFVQIYRGHQVTDLLEEQNKVSLKFNAGDVDWEHCSVVELPDVDAFVKVFREGEGRRVVREDRSNVVTSRGHVAFSVQIRMSSGEGRIVFADLAGFERFNKTDPHAPAVYREEGKTINASLLSLRQTVCALSKEGSVVPWRNTALTRLLQGVLSGTGRTSIILALCGDYQWQEASLDLGAQAMRLTPITKLKPPL